MKNFFHRILSGLASLSCKEKGRRRPGSPGSVAAPLLVVSPAIVRGSTVAAALLLVSLSGSEGHAAPPTVAPQGSSTPAVQPHLPAEVAAEEDILDIRGPIHIPAPFPWVAWTAGSLAAAGLGLGAWMLLRRPRRRLPYEVALANLEKLRPIMQPESAHAFSLAVSEIVRRFIEECLPVRAAHRTTNEFLHDLLKLPDGVLSEHRGAFEDFLTHCDLAKFARWSLTVPEMEAMLTCACTFVVAIGKPRAAKKQSATRKFASAPTADPVAVNS